MKNTMHQITAQDLRVSNYIQYKGEIIRVTMIGEYGIQSNDDDKVINAKFRNNNLQGIPLTPEILEKCGFYDMQIIYNRFQIRFNSDDTISLYTVQSGIYHFMCHCQYFHTLQNLVHALTATELTVNF